MSKINEMIKELCPNGVERVKLGEIAKLLRGKVISKTYVLEHPGIYPVYSSQTANNGEFGRIDSYMFDGKYITWTTDGIYAGTIFKREGKFNITNICGLINLNDERAIVDFVYYWLTIATDKYVNRAADNPKLMSNVVETIEIPLPPLPIQQEIVNILDKFSSLIDNLDETIQLRQKQYEYYREKLLTFKDGECEWKTLGEIGTIIRGNGLQKTDFSKEGVGCVHYGQIYTQFGFSINKTLTFVPEELSEKLTKVEPGNLIIACTSENVEDVCKSVVWLGSETIVTGGHACVFKHNENPKYIGYCFLTNNFFNQKQKYAYGAKVIDIKTEKLSLIKIPVPERFRQDEIVSSLDNFESLISNLKLERDLRQKQYEYYREKLLTFE